MRLNRKLPLALAFTLVLLAVLFGLGVLTYQQRSRVEIWKAHTYRVLLETSAMRNGLAEAQTNLRGFLLTRDEKFLPTFESHTGNFERSLRTVFDLTLDNAGQNQRIQEVENLYNRWENSALSQILARKAVPSTQSSVTLSVEGRRLFDEGRELSGRIRVLLNQVDKRERELLAQRMAASDSLRIRMESIVFGGSIVGLLAMGVLSFLLLTNMRALMNTARLLEKENTERLRVEREVRTANDSLTVQLSCIEQRNREIELLSSSGRLLQACQTLDEAREVGAQVLPQLFRSGSGAIYLYNASGNSLESVMAWKRSTAEDGTIILNREMTGDTQHFAPDDCWALRHGQSHHYERGEHKMVCRHLQTPRPATSLCVPMMAQGNVLGLLHLYDEEPQTLDDARCLLASTVADQMGLAVANLQLRETLRHQSIRDPLTNLYNRRYLEESLEHELHRAIRDTKTIGVAMMDIDHFKRFNDVHGHSAGDALLQAVSTYLQDSIRAGDIACRYGGEELTLIFPTANREKTLARVESLRIGISQIKIRYHGQVLGPVTISAGVSVFPEDATTMSELLRTADAALYAAKAAGRNCVLSYDQSTPSVILSAGSAMDSKEGSSRETNKKNNET